MGRPVHSASHYAVRLEAVLRHIDAHLAEPIALATLAGLANFSPYHFHRIFCAWQGETPQAYIRRCRLERSAALLHYAKNLGIRQIGAQCGFTSAEAFVRAFRQRFDMPPSQWRDGGYSAGPAETASTPGDFDPARVEVRYLPAVQVAYQRLLGPYGQVDTAAWAQLAELAARHGLPPGARFGIGLDDPSVTPPAHCRFDACLALPASARLPGHVPVKRIPAGLHALLPRRTDRPVAAHWHWLFSHWLPASQYSVSQQPCFERFAANQAADDGAGELCLPLAR